MLNSVMNVNIGQIESIRPVVTTQDIGDIVRHKEAESRGEVVRRSNRLAKFFESDALSRMRKNSYRDGLVSLLQNTYLKRRTYHDSP